MSAGCEKYTTDIVALKRPTTLDKLADAIPKPKGAIPNFGLPKWKVMPMESKIPMVPGPAGAYNFTRRKVGEGLWLSAADAEFNLSDPYGYEIKWTYDSLHDKHLIPYFSRPNIARHLIKAGLITKNLDAKCSLRDYNMYRKYLRRLHCDSIKKELNRRSKNSMEARAIEYAQQQAQKEVKKLQERERLMEIRAPIIKEQQEAEQLKLQKRKESQWKLEERLRALVQRKHDAHRMRLIKSKAREEMIRQKQKAAANHAQQKIIQTLLEWSKKERVRKKITESRLLQEREQKRRLVEQKWTERQEFQKKQIEKEQVLLQCIDDQRKEFIDMYNEKVDKETERMKKLFKNVKMYIQCYLARKRPGSKERICCRKYFDDEGKETPPISTKSGKSGLDLGYATPTLRKQDKKYKQRKKSQGKPKLTPGKSRKEKKGPRKTKRKAGSGTQRDKKKKRKRRKSVEKEEIESEMKSEFETLPESVATMKSETSDGTTSSIPKDKCKCQAIKDLSREPMD